MEYLYMEYINIKYILYINIPYIVYMYGSIPYISLNVV